MKFMDHTLSVVVQVDPDARFVHLLVTGSLTERNHRALCPLIHRARGLTPDATVDVDLSAAHRVESAALDLLRWSVEHDHEWQGGGPVRVLTHPAPYWSPEGPALLPPVPPVRSSGRPWTPSHRDGVAA
jgi:ABC-type transporter Mla MlaB component